jgi:F-type H+-transporting ATPase subunit b
MARALLRYLRSCLTACAPACLPTLAVAGVLLTAVPVVLAEGEDEPGEAVEELEDQHSGGHHGGPLHLDHIIHNPEFWTAVLNFSLLVFLLVKFGRAPIRDFLGGRRREMERAINEAAEAKAKAEAKLKEYTDRLSQLDSEMAKLRADLVAAGEDDKKRIVADAEETARRMKIETDALIDQHAKALSAQVRRELVDGAIATAERLLREKITAADQQQLADEFRKEISGADARRGSAERGLS